MQLEDDVAAQLQNGSDRREWHDRRAMERANCLAHHPGIAAHADLIAARLPEISEVQPNLTLEGLRIIGTLNVGTDLTMPPIVANKTILGAASLYASDFGDLKIVPSRTQRGRDLFFSDKGGCSACHVVYANDRDPLHSGGYAPFGHTGRSATADLTGDGAGVQGQSRRHRNDADTYGEPGD